MRLMMILAMLALIVGCSKQPDIIININNCDSETTELEDTIPIVDPTGDEIGSVAMNIVLGKVTKIKALQKRAAINVDQLILQLTNNATPPDTINDTTAISIPQGSADTISKIFDDIAALRTWKVVAKTNDALDSVIHWDSTTFVVYPADTTEITLDLLPLFSVYEANFLSIPDTVQSGTGEKSPVGLDSLVIYMDGNAVADSSVKPLFFVDGSNVKLSFDYVSIGTHSVKLEAYGTINDFTGLLYQGTTSLTFSAGVDDVQSVTMNWVGPTTGTGTIEVTIGRIGKVTANGTLPGTIIP